MRRKLPWPFIVVIISSFLFGALWGWKLIRDRAAEEGRLESEAKLRILAPPGLLSHELLVEFQRREKIEIDLSVETFPASLLRRALKSAPGQYDAVFLFHHQVSALRTERKLTSLYDSRVKFPTSIAPDFRKLPNDRNLMDTAPLLWGLLGVASKKELENSKTQIAFWPAPLIGLEDIGVQPGVFASKLQPMLGSFENLEKHMKMGLGGFNEVATTSLLVSHGSLAFSPLKESGLQFGPLRDHVTHEEYYPLWILTIAALSEGDIERTRKFVRFLLEPRQNITLVQNARSGATTLRAQEGLESLPKPLQASYFRQFPINKILVERDERVRSADDVLEQMVLGASLKVPKPNEATKPTATSDVEEAPVAKVKRKSKPTPEPSSDDEVEEEAMKPAGASEAPGTPSGGAPTAPSEERPHDD